MAKTQNFLNWLNAPQQGQPQAKPMDAMDAAIATPMPQVGADPMQAIQSMYQMDLLHGGGNRRRLNMDGSLQDPAAPRGLDYLEAYGPDRASVKSRQTALDNIVTGKNSPVGRVADTPELQAWAAQQLANAPQEQGNVQQLGGGIQALQTPYGSGYSQAAGSGYRPGQVIDPALGQPSADNGMTNAEQGRLAQDIMDAISYGYANDPLQVPPPSVSQSNTNAAKIPNWSATPVTENVPPELTQLRHQQYQQMKSIPARLTNQALADVATNNPQVPLLQQQNTVLDSLFYGDGSGMPGTTPMGPADFIFTDIIPGQTDLAVFQRLFPEVQAGGGNVNVLNALQPRIAQRQAERKQSRDNAVIDSVKGMSPRQQALLDQMINEQTGAPIDRRQFDQTNYLPGNDYQELDRMFPGEIPVNQMGFSQGVYAKLLPYIEARMKLREMQPKPAASQSKLNLPYNPGQRPAEKPVPELSGLSPLDPQFQQSVQYARLAYPELNPMAAMQKAMQDMKLLKFPSQQLTDSYTPRDKPQKRNADFMPNY